MGLTLVLSRENELELSMAVCWVDWTAMPQGLH